MQTKQKKEYELWCDHCCGTSKTNCTPWCLSTILIISLIIVLVSGICYGVFLNHSRTDKPYTAWVISSQCITIAGNTRCVYSLLTLYGTNLIPCEYAQTNQPLLAVNSTLPVNTPTGGQCTIHNCYMCDWEPSLIALIVSAGLTGLVVFAFVAWFAIYKIYVCCDKYRETHREFKQWQAQQGKYVPTTDAQRY